jgi:hypothetical protein
MTEETPTTSEHSLDQTAHVRGDALNTMFDFAAEHTKPTVTGIVDPVSGTTALVRIASDGSVSAIPSTVFNEYLNGPRYRTGTATLLSLASFIQHVNRFADTHSMVFADNNRAKPSLTAVLDYHSADGKNENGDYIKGQQRFGRHRSSFAFPLSDEWIAWNGINAKALTMKEFAAFLEDHIVDVMMPQDVSLSPAAAKFVDRLGGKASIADPAALMTLASNFEVFEQSNAGEKQNLSSGEKAINFETIHVDRNGQALTVPQMFVLAIPVFKMGDPFQILARLRYRKTGGMIHFYYELWRLDLIFDTAFDEAVKQVEDETGVPVLLGSPEAA